MFFVIFSLFLFPSSWAQSQPAQNEMWQPAFLGSVAQNWFTREEINKGWEATGFGLDSLFSDFNAQYKKDLYDNENRCLLGAKTEAEKLECNDHYIHYHFLSVQNCYQSERNFVACLVAINHLLHSLDNPYELRVFSFGFKIALIPDARRLEEKSVVKLEEKRESFREVFQTWKGFLSNDVFFLRDLFRSAYAKAKRGIPQEDQARVAGEVYGAFLNARDPMATFFPSQLIGRRKRGFFGVGVKIRKFEKKDDEFHGFYGLKPMEGLQAEASDLKKGDLLLAVDDVSVRGMRYSEVRNRLEGEMGSEVKLTVQDICEDRQRDVILTRKFVPSIVSGMEDHHFVNLHELEPSTCGGEKQTSLPLDSDVAKALYVSISSFFPDPNRKNDSTQAKLCEEFVNLQIKDINEPDSIGMIIDLRRNTGGLLDQALCMLDTIIQSTGILLERLPVKEGKILESGERRTMYFTENSFLPNNGGTYNKNIVVLMDRNSASTSEIFAGTIQDMKRGYVVGERSSGKGTIQVMRNIGSAPNPPIFVQETNAIYILNSGRSPENYGIFPDFSFSRTGEFIQYDHHSANVVGGQHSSNWIDFKNVSWERNRPNEVAEIEKCMGEKNRMGEILKEKMTENERYTRPFASDYQLEAAKDVLFCMLEVPSIHLAAQASE